MGIVEPKNVRIAICEKKESCGFYIKKEDLKKYEADKEKVKKDEQKVITDKYKKYYKDRKWYE
jgi:hypothetical protein